jgi:Na+/H+ antiporter NhaD/arsenite permease-like protein
MPFSLVILLLVFTAIAIRRLSPIRIPIWLIMLAGAAIVLLTKQISIPAAIQSINWNIMGYLLGTFILGKALEMSGFLQRICYYTFRHIHSPCALLLSLFFIVGFASALLMNDTIAIMMTPMLIVIARHNKLPSQPLLLGLAYAVTIGSVMSPIGNPQNLLIAIQGHLSNPFLLFFSNLWFPTVINLLLGFAVIWFSFRRRLQHQTLQWAPLPFHHENLTKLSKAFGTRGNYRHGYNKHMHLLRTHSRFLASPLRWGKSFLTYH